MGDVRVIPGGVHRDARGVVRFVNQLELTGLKRAYTIVPETDEVRGWVGHRRDWKWFWCVAGAFEIAVTQPTTWDPPEKDLIPKKYVLEAEQPFVLEVPAGHFTAIRRLHNGSVLLVLSTGAIEESKTDDYRIRSTYWPFFSGG